MTTTMTPDDTDDDLRSAFAAISDVPTDRLPALHARLVAAAARSGDLDVTYRTLDSPAGVLLLAATERGVVRVAFPVEDQQAVLQTLSERISPRILRAPARLEPATRQLGEYFDGRRRRFDLALDRRLSAGFRRHVLTALSEVEFGTTTTYAALARQVGSPRAVRAAGSACATNPLPILVPCHRVLRSDGGLGGYLGGVEVKRALLDLEAAAA